MTSGQKPSFEEVALALRYEAQTGEFYWLPRDELGSSGRRGWNRKYAGKPALTYLCAGYLSGTLLGSAVLAHRVAWLLHYGEWPAGQIDHINGDRTDNRIENLRVVTATENNRNRKVPKTNISGRIGVSRSSRSPGRWQAFIKKDGKSRYLGSYRSVEEASEARQKAERALGYHENHGRA